MTCRLVSTSGGVRHVDAGTEGDEGQAVVGAVAGLAGIWGVDSGLRAPLYAYSGCSRDPPWAGPRRQLSGLSDYPFDGAWRDPQHHREQLGLAWQSHWPTERQCLEGDRRYLRGRNLFPRGVQGHGRIYKGRN